MKLADIAKAAGVSSATVSRVINNRPGVSSQNVQAVRDTMARLGYTPASRVRSASRLGPGIRTGNIAMILLGVRHPEVPHPSLYAAVQQSVEMSVRQKGLNFLLVSMLPDSPLPAQLADGAVDGAILLPGREASDVMLGKLPPVPCVLVLTRRAPSFRGDSVLPDEEATARIALDYLVSRGHRHVAFLDGVPSLADHAARGEAFQRAAARAGLPVTMLVDADGRLDLRNEAAIHARIEQLVERLVHLSPRPTGVFVPSDLMAARVHRGLAQRKVRPGTDIALISCNNEWATLAGLDPRPATIDLREATIGRRAVDQLLWRIANPDEPGRMRILIEPALVENAPPPP